MGFLFNLLVYRPVYNLLIFVYNHLPVADFGLAIIIVTVIIKFILLPLGRKQIEAQKKMQELQPKLKEIQNKYKNDKEKQGRAVMEFYRENKANPFAGCLPTIFQLIFLIAIYRVLFNISDGGLRLDGQSLYSFVVDPGQINQYFLGIVDLSRSVDFGNINLASVPHILVVVLAAFSQYYQTKMLMAKNQKSVVSDKKDKNSEPDFAQAMTQQMLYVGPLLTLFIGIKFPAGLALYWLSSTVFSIVQQYYIMKERKEEALVTK
jgi:YidC/Oxa1 family membrane protein insertase